MKYNKILMLTVFLLYLVGVRVLLNITYHDWLSARIGEDLTGSLIWSGIKIVHWCLPIFMYLIFVEKRFLGYFKEKYSIQFNWSRMLIFIVIWGLITIATSGLRKPEIDPYTLIYNVLITAFVEELVFRGFVLDILHENFSFTKANILQSVFFSLNHLPWLYMIGVFKNPFNLIYLLLFYVVFGVVSGYLTKNSRSLWPSTIFHAVNNFLS